MNKVLAQSRVTEVNTVGSRICDLFKTSKLDSDTHLSGIVANLDSSHEEFTKAIKQISAESNLDNSDGDISHAVRSLFHLVDGYTWYPSNKISEPAQLVNKVLDNYGLKMIHESYAIQTSLVDSLLFDMGKDDVKEALNTLPGCNIVVKMLAQAQSEFKQEYINYEKQKVESDKLESASKIKNRVLDIINNKLIVYLQAMVQVDEATYSAFANAVEQMIKDSNSAVRQRKAKSSVE